MLSQAALGHMSPRDRATYDTLRATGHRIKLQTAEGAPQRALAISHVTGPALPPVLQGCGSSLFGTQDALRRLHHRHIVIIQAEAAIELVHMARQAHYREFVLGGQTVRKRPCGLPDLQGPHGPFDRASIEGTVVFCHPERPEAQFVVSFDAPEVR